MYAHTHTQTHIHAHIHTQIHTHINTDTLPLMKKIKPTSTTVIVNCKISAHQWQSHCQLQDFNASSTAGSGQPASIHCRSSNHSVTVQTCTTSTTLTQSLKTVAVHVCVLSQNWKPVSSPLHTNLSFYQSITSNACICSVCKMIARVIKLTVRTCLWSDCMITHSMHVLVEWPHE